MKISDRPFILGQENANKKTMCHFDTIPDVGSCHFLGGSVMTCNCMVMMSNQANRHGDVYEPYCINIWFDPHNMTKEMGFVYDSYQMAFDGNGKPMNRQTMLHKGISLLDGLEEYVFECVFNGSEYVYYVHADDVFIDECFG